MFFPKFIFVIFVILAVLQVIYPKQAFMFGKRWQFKEGAEPSDLSIFMTRVSGIIVLLVMLYFMFALH